jgi:tRNA-splicing ligase RtcB
VCVGTVLGTDDLLYPSAVGGDIGCGMAAVVFGAKASLVDNERAAARVLAGLYERVPTNRHRAKQYLTDTLEPSALSDPKLARLASREGAVQLGTLGGGNHFLELQADNEGRLWAMVHSGSRGMGQHVSSLHRARAERGGEGLHWLDSETDTGRVYLADLEWCRRYAAQSRLAMLGAVETLLDELFGVAADWGSLVHADHNHVRRESYGGRNLWVHRKGAQPAAVEEQGIIPGSMGTFSVLTSGRGCVESLCSSSHGAGRRLSRGDARRAVSAKALAQQVGRLWYDHRHADGLREEAPSAYKDLRQVLQSQRELTKTIRELRPVLSYKGL